MNRSSDKQLPRLLIAGVLIVTSLALLSCSDDAPIAPPAPSGPRNGVLYVIEGGTGDGSIEEPLGTIQRALEAAFRSPEFRVINVGIGDFNGSPRVRTSVTINGSLDPKNDWQLSTTGRTTIVGAKLDSLAIGVMVRNLSGRVTFNNINIIAGVATDSGESSIGLYCQSAGDVVLNNCEVTSGDGMTGATGARGSSGLNGDDANRQEAGVNPSAGGRGGVGGLRDIVQPSRGFDGDHGLCFDSLPGGGLGGLAGTTGDGSPGLDGPAGTDGTTGSGGVSKLLLQLIDPYVIVLAVAGSDAGPGDYGCGGGGGGGSASIWNPNPAFSFKGHVGGGGGGGGFPGQGGSGGGGGGSSVGILAYQSNITLVNCLVASASGGDGAIGGVGGIGGKGGAGGVVDFVIVGGGIGGRGGDGGRGGQGGGGAGGWSIGIASYQAVIDTSSVRFQVGQPGLGGAGDSLEVGRGANGSVAEILDIQSN